MIILASISPSITLLEKLVGPHWKNWILIRCFGLGRCHNHTTKHNVIGLLEFLLYLFLSIEEVKKRLQFFGNHLETHLY